MWQNFCHFSTPLRHVGGRKPRRWTVWVVVLKPLLVSVGVKYRTHYLLLSQLFSSAFRHYVRFCWNLAIIVRKLTKTFFPPFSFFLVRFGIKCVLQHIFFNRALSKFRETSTFNFQRLVCFLTVWNCGGINNTITLPLVFITSQLLRECGKQRMGR